MCLVRIVSFKISILFSSNRFSLQSLSSFICVWYAFCRLLPYMQIFFFFWYWFKGFRWRRMPNNLPPTEIESFTSLNGPNSANRLTQSLISIQLKSQMSSSPGAQPESLPIEVTQVPNQWTGNWAVLQWTQFASLNGQVRHTLADNNLKCLVAFGTKWMRKIFGNKMQFS